MFTKLRARRDDLHLTLMLALTFSTGVIDAVGYLGLDKVFAGNMTGNVVILGMALTGADDLPWVGPLLALFTFMAGALVSGRVLRRRKAGWSTATTWLFTAVGVVLAGLAVALLVLGGRPPQPWELIITGFLAAAMGMQAGAARHIAVKDVTTVVVTSTITGFAFDSRLGGATGQPWFRRFAAIVLIAAGAAVGALLLNLQIGWGVAAAAIITLVAALLGHVAAHDRYAPAPAVAAVEDAVEDAAAPAATAAPRR